MLLQNEVEGSTKLQGSLESSVTQLQQSLKQRDVDCSKMMLEVQVSYSHRLIITKPLELLLYHLLVNRLIDMHWYHNFIIIIVINFGLPGKLPLSSVYVYVIIVKTDVSSMLVCNFTFAECTEPVVT